MNLQNTTNYFDILPDEIVLEIIDKCEFKDKISFIETNKKLNKFKLKMSCNFFMTYSKIDNLIQKNKIKVGQIRKLLFDVKHIDKNKLMKFTNLIHLKFNLFFDESILRCIPDSVTHLEFGDCFN